MGSVGGSRVSQDSLTNLSNLLPTGTFLTFQALVPLFSNNGKCGLDEKVLSGILIFLFIVLNFMLSFVDSITTSTGKVYYGLVTPDGLFNPQFKTLNIDGDLKSGDYYYTGGIGIKDYVVHWSDFVNGVLNVIVFCTLSGLTPPVSSCYYPGIPDQIARTAPILVAMVVGVFFVFFPAGRHGVGFALTPSGFGFVQEASDPPAVTSQPVDASSTSPQHTAVAVTKTVTMLRTGQDGQAVLEVDRDFSLSMD